jgi:hypothetical protein
MFFTSNLCVSICLKCYLTGVGTLWLSLTLWVSGLVTTDWCWGSWCYSSSLTQSEQAWGAPPYGCVGESVLILQSRGCYCLILLINPEAPSWPSLILPMREVGALLYKLAKVGI